MIKDTFYRDVQSLASVLIKATKTYSKSEIFLFQKAIFGFFANLSEFKGVRNAIWAYEH